MYHVKEDWEHQQKLMLFFYPSADSWSVHVKSARERVVMFFGFGLSGVFYVFLKNGHNIGARTKKFFRRR